MKRVLGRRRRVAREQAGYTIVELVVALVVLSLIVFSTLQLFVALVNSALLMKRKGVALSLATNQMEYLKSLPYDALAVSGGSIIASSYIPAVTTQTISGMRYTVTTSINYVDEAYDGCASYPTLVLKQKYCRNYPPPASAPATDTNPADYKVAHVKVSTASGLILSDVDTQIAARVAETASSTGALFVTVIDSDGDPLSGATVNVTNTTISPSVAISDVTDQNGMAIFYGLPPDTTNYDYVIRASSTGFSTLSTIAPSGTLQPNYKNVQILAQQSSSVTVPLFPMGADSVVLEVVDTSGVAVPNARIYVKGGYKKYTASTDFQYYFDNVSPSDTRVATDAGGLVALSNLVPGDYYICGDTGSTSCVVGGSAYHALAAVPYAGDNAFSPINIPIYDASSPPSTTYEYGGKQYYQKVRVIIAPSGNWPRLTTLTPAEANLSTPTINAFPFQIKGANLPCSSNPASCSTVVRVKQGANTFSASCVGTSAGLTLDCTVNLSTAVAGATYLEVVANGHTLTLPSDMKWAGINVAP